MLNLPARASALSSLADALNPVLVKEARQAMRGRSFTGGFTMIQVFAVLITGICFVSGVTTENGLQLLKWLTLSLAGVLYLYLPLASFQSMASEWDERAIDHLVLSRLRPSAVLLGKLQWAAAQAGLFVLGYLPFTILCLLLRGVDVATVLLFDTMVLVQSTTLCAIALGLGAFAERRAMRPLCLIVIVLASVVATSSTFVRLFVVLGGAVSVSLGTIVLPLGIFILGQAILGGFAILGGVLRLGHELANRSTPLRVYTSASFLVGMLLLAFVSPASGSPPGSAVVVSTSGFLAGATFQSTLLLAVPSALFVTEKSALPSRSARRLPRAPLLAVLAAPWLPGGQRGLLFAALHIGLALVVLPVLAPDAPWTYWWRAPGSYAVLVYLTVTASIAMLFPTGSSRRAGFRVGVVLITIVGMNVLPAFVVLLRLSPPAILALLALTLPLLVWHVQRGVMEVVRCSQRNREVAALTPP